eukprot:193621_1
MSTHKLLQISLITLIVIYFHNVNSHCPPCKCPSPGSTKLEKDPCSTDEMKQIIDKKSNQDPTHISAAEHGFHNIHAPISRRKLLQYFGNIDIAVTFHVLYDSKMTANKAQMDTINKYSTFIDIIRKVNLHFNRPPIDSPWKDVLDNMDITFFINEIKYKDVKDKIFCWFESKMKSSTTGGSNPIDSDYNLNIWFVRPNPGCECKSAYAIFPQDEEKSGTLGIVVNIGLINGDTSWPDHIKKTTITHEIGHWVGLKHIWGKNPANCKGSDGVYDTPPMGRKYSGICPKHGAFSCDDKHADMFQNYMSYSSCKNMFTIGQVDKARLNFDLSDGIKNRQSFVTYPRTKIKFVNMIYFVIGKSTRCMPGDKKRNVDFNAGRSGSYAKHIFLCVSYSNNPNVEGYEDIKFNTQIIDCLPGYSRMDTNLNEAALGYYLCYKKVAQTKPLSKDTMINVNVFKLEKYQKKIKRTENKMEIEYTLIKIDLNQGGPKGYQIYLGYAKNNQKMKKGYVEVYDYNTLYGNYSLSVMNIMAVSLIAMLCCLICFGINIFAGGVGYIYGRGQRESNATSKGRI